MEPSSVGSVPSSQFIVVALPQVAVPPGATIGSDPSAQVAIVPSPHCSEEPSLESAGVDPSSQVIVLGVEPAPLVDGWRAGDEACLPLPRRWWR